MTTEFKQKGTVRSCQLPSGTVQKDRQYKPSRHTGWLIKSVLITSYTAKRMSNDFVRNVHQARKFRSCYKFDCKLKVNSATWIGDFETQHFILFRWFWFFTGLIGIGLAVQFAIVKIAKISTILVEYARQMIQISSEKPTDSAAVLCTQKQGI